jgi:hypothetical protein
VLDVRGFVDGLKSVDFERKNEENVGILSVKRKNEGFS